MATAKSKKDKQAFRDMFDPNVIIPNKIRAAFAALAKEEGPEAWETEVDFLRRAKLNAQAVGPHREAFKAHTVEGKNTNRKPVTIWFADPKHAADMRRTLG